jgi:hypothetical protein
MMCVRVRSVEEHKILAGSSRVSKLDFKYSHAFSISRRLNDHLILKSNNSYDKR